MGSSGLINSLGWSDAQIWPTDWDLVHNSFWTSFIVSLLAFPCLFYLTWYLNPSLSNNRLGLSWVLGFYSASLFTLGGFHEAPHLRTVFNAAVDYLPTSSVGDMVATTLAPSTSLVSTCLPMLSTAAALLASRSTSVQPSPALPLSFLHLDSDASPKYYCFSDLTMSPRQLQQQTDAQSHIDEDKCDISLRHKLYQAQMTAPHLAFSLENYPDDGRIGPHIIAANFQAFLVADLLMGFLHYRRQLEPFSTVVHHIIYYFIVVHMRKGDMLSVFCILGTFIESKWCGRYITCLPPLLQETISRMVLDKHFTNERYSFPPGYHFSIKHLPVLGPYVPTAPHTLCRGLLRSEFCYDAAALRVLALARSLLQLPGQVGGGALHDHADPACVLVRAVHPPAEEVPAQVPAVAPERGAAVAGQLGPGGDDAAQGQGPDGVVMLLFLAAGPRVAYICAAVVE